MGCESVQPLYGLAERALTLIRAYHLEFGIWVSLPSIGSELGSGVVLL